MRYFWEQMSSNHSRSTDFKLAIPETDLSRIVQWEDVNNGEQYEVYFTQRLGPDFDEVPVILISREAFKRLLRGENALFAEMLAADKEAMKDLYFSFSPDKNHSVIMGLSIEHPNVGQRAIRFIEEHKRTEEHEEWLKKLREVSEKSRALHRSRRLPTDFSSTTSIFPCRRRKRRRLVVRPRWARCSRRERARVLEH